MVSQLGALQLFCVHTWDRSSQHWLALSDTKLALHLTMCVTWQNALKCIAFPAYFSPQVLLPRSLLQS